VSLGADGAERFIGGAGRHGQGVAGTASD
jgi:hypothetical protein